MELVEPGVDVRGQGLEQDALVGAANANPIARKPERLRQSNCLAPAVHEDLGDPALGHGPPDIYEQCPPQMRARPVLGDGDDGHVVLAEDELPSSVTVPAVSTPAT
jgi:hypothetical protein